MFKFEILKTIYNKRTGSALILTLVFGSIFLMSFGAILSLILAQNRALDRKVASSEALEIAEAGLNQYRWRLAHDHGDFTGADEDYYDPYGELIGHYTVTVIEPEVGSSIVELTSIGWTIDYPSTTRTLRARYGKESLAKFAFVTNSNVWFGEDEEVVGMVHSNGGIRMDGQCDSRMTTIKETYICGGEHGCADEEKDGIWGEGEIEELWDFPITEGVDFDGLAVDLDNMHTEAVASGIYLGDSGDEGYLVEFHADGKFSIDIVTSLRNPVWGYNGSGWVNESNSYQNTSALGGYQNIDLPANGLIFLEDEVWVEGEVNGRATLVAARLPAGEDPNASIRIQNDLTYTAKDGSDVLGVIGQEDVLVPLYTEDVLEIDAALMAQSGHTYRYYYPVNQSWCRWWCWSSPYSTYGLRDKIETYGTNITNTIWTWSWTDGVSTVSGFDDTETTYDPYLIYAPPPHFPTEDEYEFISWEEILPTEE